MTSNRRGVIKRDYNHQEYKSFDPFQEPNLISILFLSCGRPKLTKVCLERLVESTSRYTGKLEWIFYEGGDEGDCLENIKLFNSFSCERKKIITTNDNWGINCGFNDLHRIARGEFHVEMESDWYCVNPSFNWLESSKEIFWADSRIGIVQLRSVFDSSENWALRKKDYSPWTCDRYRIDRTVGGHEFLLAEDFFGYNHNPMAIRTSTLQDIIPLPEPEYHSDPRHGETFSQIIYREKQHKISHINTPLFEHVGGCLRKQYEAKAN